MAEIPKSSKGSFKNEVFKRPSSGTRDKNVRKQQKREDYPVQMLPAMSGSCNGPSVEISPKEKSLKAAYKLDLNSTLPDLNEAAPSELVSIKDVDQDGPSFIANDLLEAVQVVRTLEIEGYISGIFRMKFLSFLGLKATAKERDVVRTFMRTMGDDPRCLAGQLIDSFSGVVNMKP
ncbi:uncharacterized protein [Primulina eburnea]|uniref:uncharacterized protein isoform X3 n=1 Tax=Primulina eburnea TaxID=1245227 RepID=UPI003C6C52E9